MSSKVFNHLTDGEIGKMLANGEMVNHGVLDAVGLSLTPTSLVNHAMSDAAPSSSNVINHNMGDCTDPKELAKVLGVHHYPGRVLGSTLRGDVVQFHPDLKAHWDWITRHYRQIGLEHSDQIIWDDDFGRFTEFTHLPVSVFFFGENAHRARPDDAWFNVVQLMNSKNEFVKLAGRLGIPTPKTDHFSTKEEVGDCREFEYPLFLKLAVSVSGAGVVRCENPEALERELARVESGIAFQLQADVGPATFINLQYCVNGCGVKRFVATEQVLDGVSHNGNAFPTRYQPWSIIDPLADWMHQKGMRGYFAFDLAITPDGASYAIECNPRWNGSTYPSNIAQKLGINMWKAMGMKTRFRKLDDIDLGELEFKPNLGGVIVYNWGCITEGKLGVMIVGNYDNQREIERKLLLLLQ